MKCINFRIENKYDNFLNKIFENINVEKYHWEIGYCEILYKESNKILDDTIFPSESLDGLTFKRCIALKEYYLIFADLKAFSNPSDEEIDTLSDFLNSDCKIALFCTDSISIEIYLKEEEVFDTIIDNCKRYKFRDLEILTEENHGRTHFFL